MSICSKHCNKGGNWWGTEQPHGHFTHPNYHQKHFISSRVHYAPAEYLYSDKMPPGAYAPLAWTWTVYVEVPPPDYPEWEWFQANPFRDASGFFRSWWVPIAMGSIHRRFTPDSIAGAVLKGRGWKMGRVPGLGDPVVRRLYEVLYETGTHTGGYNASQVWESRLSIGQEVFVVPYSMHIRLDDLALLWMARRLREAHWYEGPGPESRYKPPNNYWGPFAP